MRHKWLFFLFFMLTTPMGRAFDFPSVYTNGLGGATILSDGAASDQVSLISANVKRTGFVCGYQRNYELKELDQYYLAVSKRMQYCNWAVGVSQLGQSDFYAEKMVKSAIYLSYKNYGFGVILSCLRLEFGGGYSSLSASAVGCGFNGRHRSFYYSVNADNLNTPSLTRSSPVYQPVYKFNLEYKGEGAFSLVSAVEVEKNKKPRYAFGQIVRISNFSRLFWGLSS